MNEQLIAQIRQAFAAGLTLEQVVGGLKKKGLSSSEVTGLFRLAVSGESVQRPVATAAPTTGSSQSQTMPPAKSFFTQLDATQTFIFVGLLLIVVAVVIVMTMLWAGVTPFVRILFVVGPMLLLYGIAAVTGGKKELHDIHEGTLVTASVILPFAVATTLYQSNLIPEINYLLAAISAFVGYIGFATLEFLTGRRQLAPLTIISLYLWIGSALWYLKVDQQLVLGLLFVISALVTGFGLYLQSRQQTNGRLYSAVGVVGLYLFLAWLLTVAQTPVQNILWLEALLSVGVLAMGSGMLQHKLADGESYVTVGCVLGALLVPSALYATLNTPNPLSIEVNGIIIAVFGPFYLALSMALQRYPQLKPLKRFFEELAPFVLLLSLATVGFSNSAFMVIVLLLGFIYIYLSILVPLQILLPLGTIGLVVAILDLAARYFVNSVGLPIVVLITGFALIGLSFFVRRISELRKTHQLKPYYGIGVDPDDPTSVGSLGGGCLRIVGLLFVLLILLPILFFSLRSWL